MKAKEMYQLKAGESIVHKRYGKSTVKKIIPDFGAVILPDSIDGKILLAKDSGINSDTPLLEDDCRMMKKIP